ncbi:SPL family radical SAM protein [Clostridium aminobutyricum]|uniref:Spore photoproduct lyase n=1 Tax=Clostridium aminobutyricum TaxID=33953 RepID=A0A939DBN3_CLOAM|nr:radical SAM protein [Clostridium aminobutyricum]MBN7774323.1 spore photoproduct lyase [Clostridium aminobutyricum]
MNPKIIYYEEESLHYELGKTLFEKFKSAEWIKIDNHNNIPELRNNPNCEFARMKQNLVIGIRKTHKYVPNSKTSDFLVPYTSSGCSAMCLYCYLVCNYNKCSYLRLFVNREQMLAKLIKTAKKSETDLTFEIGSNSDLILENTITGNLEWTIEQFGENEKGYITLPTKFDMVEPLLPLKHKGRTIIRMSVNPQDIINKVEFGTASLTKRIQALNRLKEAGYQVGILVAPIVLIENWETLYRELFTILSDTLSEKVKKDLLIEIIFMTYSYIHRMINQDAFPNALDLYDKELMTGRGRGRYCYKNPIRNTGEEFFRAEIQQKLPESKIMYIV